MHNLYTMKWLCLELSVIDKVNENNICPEFPFHDHLPGGLDILSRDCLRIWIYYNVNRPLLYGLQSLKNMIGIMNRIYSEVISNAEFLSYFMIFYWNCQGLCNFTLSSINLLLFLWYGSVHVHMRTFCKISLNHWTQLALISPNIIRKKFIILSTILFILHTLFHYNIEVPCAYVKCYFALSLFQPVLQGIFSHKLLKKENATTIPFCGWGNWSIQGSIYSPNSTSMIEKQVRVQFFCSLLPMYSLL